MIDETPPDEVYFMQCFGTGSGRIVLKYMLMRAGLFRSLETTEELAVENFMKEILNCMGMYDVIMVDKIFNVPIRKEKTRWLKRKLRKLRSRK